MVKGGMLMFIECQLCLCKPVEEDVISFSKRKDALFNTLSEKYNKYNPKIVIDTFWECSNITDNMVDELLSFLNQHQIKYDLYLVEKVTDKDIYNSRFVEFLVEGDYIDEDNDGIPLNNYDSLICSSCNLYDDKIIPNPYLISTKSIKKNQDVYHCNNGILVISERLKNFLQENTEDEVLFGEIKIQGSILKKSKLKGTYYWMRPKYLTGYEIGSSIKEVCDVCNHPIEIRSGLIDKVCKNYCGTITFQKATLEISKFPDNECNIALSGTWYGRRTLERPMSIIRSQFISGTLFKKLEAFNVKGLVKPTKIIHVK